MAIVLEVYHALLLDILVHLIQKDLKEAGPNLDHILVRLQLLHLVVLDLEVL